MRNWGKLTRAGDADHAKVKARLAALTERCTSIEALPTWPLNITLWHRLIGRTVNLAAPLFVDLLNPDGIAGQVIETIPSIVQGSPS